MRLFFLLSFHCFILNQSSAQCWEAVDTPISADTVGTGRIFLLNENLGWAVGDWGYILNTTDGGNSWDILLHDRSMGVFLDIVFFDEQNGLSITSRDKILKTSDGGRTWNTIKTYDRWHDNLREFYFHDKNNGWITGQSVFEKTTDGGDNWEKYNFPGDSLIVYRTVFFLNNKDGYLGIYSLEKEAQLFKTQDGGVSWTEIKTITEKGEIRKIQFYDENTGWVLKSNGIYKTTNGGVNWTQQIGDRNFVDMIMFDTLTGWATSAGQSLYATIDGGKNWIQQSHDRSLRSGSLVFQSPKKGLASHTNRHEPDNYQILNYNPIATECDLSIESETVEIDSLGIFPKFSWKLETGCVDGYIVNVGFSEGSNELINNKVLPPYDSCYILNTTIPKDTFMYFSIKPISPLEPNIDCGSIRFDTNIVSETSNNNNLRTLIVFPNPATDKVFLESSLFSNEDFIIQLINSKGQIIKKLNNYNLGRPAKIEIVLSDVTNGCYFLQIVSKEKTIIKKLIINN